MNTPWRAKDTFKNISNFFGEELNINLERSRVSCYQGLGHALVEVCLGLAKLYSLKKKIYYFKEQSVYFDQALIHLAREGYKITPLNSEILEHPEDWIQQLQRDDLMLLYAADDSFLGRTFDTGALDAALTEKSISNVRVSHARHFYESRDYSSIPKNRVEIISVDPQLTLGFFGERVRIAPLVSDQLDYSEIYEKVIRRDWIAKLKMPMKLSQSLILDFEQKKIAGCKSFFSNSVARIYDRAIVYWEDMEATAFLDQLEEELQTSFLPNQVQTPSLFRWQAPELINHISQPGFGPEVYRGLILLSHELLNSFGEKLETAMLSARSKVLLDQLGS